MAEQVVDVLEDLKKAVKTPKLILGARRSMIALKAGNVEKVYVTANAPESVKNDLAHYALFVPVEVVQVDIDSDEMGIVCKRQHNVCVASLLR